MEQIAKVAAPPAVAPGPKPGAPATGPAPITVLPAAGAARVRRRHFGLVLSFVVFVIAPLVVAGWYLFTLAEDQYASHVGFSVRTEEASSAFEFLGGITGVSGSSSSDTDILYEFIQSQQMVRAIAAQIPLTEVYQRPSDPIFALGDDTRIEALSDYWRRMVKVFYDRSSGLIEVRVLAFDPASTNTIAMAIYEESSAMINELSAIARDDATRYAEEELTRATERLKQARQATTAFRTRTRIVDPSADLQGQMGLLNSLQVQLAGSLIERGELLMQTGNTSDPRLVNIERRIEVIEDQIDLERTRFSAPDGGEQAFTRLLEEYEALEVDREFAEQSFLSAQATYDAAIAEAQRQSRYLASYILPTRAETAEYPRRIVLLLVTGGFLFVLWSIGAMAYYSLRDRR